MLVSQIQRLATAAFVLSAVSVAVLADRTIELLCALEATDSCREAQVRCSDSGEDAAITSGEDRHAYC